MSERLLEVTHPQSEQTQTAEAAAQKRKSDRRGLICSVLTLVLSIPAIIGAWCWPALVIGLISGTVTASARSMGHLISFIIVGFMMILVVAYVGYKARTREPPHWNQYGPFYMSILAALLIMSDQLRQLLLDHVDGLDNLAMYRDDCDAETLKCLSPVGWGFTIMVWFGFFFLIWSTMWTAHIVEKLRELRMKWHEIRNPDAYDYSYASAPAPEGAEHYEELSPKYLGASVPTSSPETAPRY